MKKTVIISVSILFLTILGWAGSSYLINRVMEKSYFSIIKNLDPDKGLTVTGLSYSRGILSATATSNLIFSVYPAETEAHAPFPQTLELALHHQIQPGIALSESGSISVARITTKLHQIKMNGHRSATLDKVLARIKASPVISTVLWSGAIHTSMTLYSADQPNLHPDIEWQQVAIFTEYTPREKTLHGRFKMPRLRFLSDSYAFSSRKLSGEITISRADPGQIVLENSLELINTEIKLRATNKVIRLNEIKIVADTAGRNGTVKSRQRLQARGASFTGTAIKTGILDIEFKNLPGTLFKNFNGSLQKWYLLSSVENLGQLTDFQQVDFTPHNSNPNEDQPEIELHKFQIETSHGDIDVQGEVQFSSGNVLGIRNWLNIFDHLGMDLRLSLPEKLLRTIALRDMKNNLLEARARGLLPQFSDAKISALANEQVDLRIKSAIAQNFVAREGPLIKTHARIEGGKLRLNNQYIPLSDSK